MNNNPTGKNQYSRMGAGGNRPKVQVARRIAARRDPGVFGGEYARSRSKGKLAH